MVGEERCWDRARGGLHGDMGGWKWKGAWAPFRALEAFSQAVGGSWKVWTGLDVHKAARPAVRGQLHVQHVQYMITSFVAVVIVWMW